MEPWTKAQNLVFKLAKEKLQQKPWYKGVCTDNFPSQEDIDDQGIEKSVDDVIIETAMWDDPEFF